MPLLMETSLTSSSSLSHERRLEKQLEHLSQIVNQLLQVDEATGRVTPRAGLSISHCRRLWRQLDKTLSSIHESASQLDIDNDHHHQSIGQGSLQRASLQHYIVILLAHLPWLPADTADLEDTQTRIFEQLTLLFSTFQCRLEPSTTLLDILQRLLMPYGSPPVVVTLACLMAVNHTWTLATAESKLEANCFIPIHVSLKLVSELLPRAIATIEGAPWDLDLLNDRDYQTGVQWRLLLCYVFKELDLHYEQSQHQLLDQSTSNDDALAFPAWLERVWDQHDQVHKDNNHMAFTGSLKIQLFWQALTHYLDHLLDYTLDALDGARVAAADAAIASDLDSSTAAVFLSAVQDILRQLNVVQFSFQVIAFPQSKYYHSKLWNAMADFLVGHGVWNQADSGMALSTGFCSSLLQIAMRSAEEQLQQLHNIEQAPAVGISVQTINLTLLRAIPHPDLLLAASGFWNLLQAKAREHREVKYVCMASILNFMQSSGPHQASASSVRVKERLTELLSNLHYNNDNDEHASVDHDTNDPWDEYLSRQFAKQQR